MAVNEFVFLLEAVGGELELTLINENPADTQKNRRDSNKPGGVRRKDFIKGEKEDRRRPGQSEPNFIGPHLPIILIDIAGDTDTVEWRCANPFVMDVAIDLSYKRRPPNGNNKAPRSPFDVFGNAGTDLFPTPQASTPNAGGQHFIKGQLKKGNNGPADHLFYKASFWSGGLTLDPDFFCDR